MCLRLRLLAFLAILSRIGIIAAQPERGQRFAGSWQAKVNDSVICTIELRAGNGISGHMQGCRIQTDADGNILDPEPSEGPSRPSPISKARITGAVLSFDCRDEGEAEPTMFELTLVREGVADLVIKNAPVKIKPIRFVRASTAKGAK